MKHCINLLLSSLSFALLLLYSCEDETTHLAGNEKRDSHLMLEAREYFEEYASIEMEGEPQGLHPGNIAPEWDKAKAFFNAGTMAINVPLVTEATYEGSFYSGDVAAASGEPKDTYYTAMLQRLVVVKSLETNIYSCYIATIIPSEAHATKNRSKIDRTFYSGDPDSEFSGTVVYSTVTTNYTISVEKYVNGVMYQEESLFDAGSTNIGESLDNMSQLLCAGRIKRNVRAMTKNGEYGFGGQTFGLFEVVVTAPAPTRPVPPPPPPSLPPPPAPPVPPTTSPNNPPSYPPPGYVPPTSPPKTGGGRQDGRSKYPKLSSPNPDYGALTEEVNRILPALYELLKGKGIDLNDFKLSIATLCATNARIEEDGSIGICAGFVNNGYTLNDQASILWHEVYHVLNDKPCSVESQKLPSALTFSNIPGYIENFLRNDLYGGGVSGDAYQYEITVSSLLPPQYYRNEIAAYEAEMRNGFNVSPAYARERAFLYWRHQQNLKFAEKYYKR